MRVAFRHARTLAGALPTCVGLPLGELQVREQRVPEELGALPRLRAPRQLLHRLLPAALQLLHDGRVLAVAQGACGRTLAWFRLESQKPREGRQFTYQWQGPLRTWQQYHPTSPGVLARSGAVLVAGAA